MKFIIYIFLLAAVIINVRADEVEESQGNIYTILVMQDSVELGEMKIVIFPEIAPEHCRNFDSLVSVGFFNGTAFHRVIPGILIQGGDPNTVNKPKNMWGVGDPSQRKIKAEFNNTPHTRGIISAARTSDPDSHTSQFFICLTELSQLDFQYSVFGRVIDGIEIADEISRAPKDEKDMPFKNVTVRIWRND